MSKIINNITNYESLFNNYLNLLSKCDMFKYRCEEIFSKTTFLDEFDMMAFVLLIENIDNETGEFETLRRMLLLREIDCETFVESCTELNTF